MWLTVYYNNTAAQLWHFTALHWLKNEIRCTKVETNSDIFPAQTI
jgi:hypothetical protein